MDLMLLLGTLYTSYVIGLIFEETLVGRILSSIYDLFSTVTPLPLY
jgi:hypothetical protein